MKADDAKEPPEASTPNFQREYWSGNLDARNLGEECAGPLDLNEELEFYFSPEQKYALKRLWGECGPKGQRILEIGCGLGVFALFLARQEAEVYVIDIAPARLARLREEARRHGVEDRIRIVCARAENMPFPDEFFDAVYTKSVLIHTELNAAAAEAARVMKKGGRGVFVEPMTGNPFARLYRRFLAPKEWKNITRYFTRPRLKRLSAPFKKGRVRYFYFFGFLAFAFQFGMRNLPLFNFAMNVMKALDDVLFSLAPHFKRMAWFAVLTVRK